MSDNIAVSQTAIVNAAITAPKVTPKVVDLDVGKIGDVKGQDPADKSNVVLANELTSRNEKVSDKSLEFVHSAVDNLNLMSEKTGAELNFSVDKGTGSTVISVTDKITEDLIRQIPSEEAIRISQFVTEQGGFSDPVLSTLGLSERV